MAVEHLPWVKESDVAKVTLCPRSQLSLKGTDNSCSLPPGTLLFGDPSATLRAAQLPRWKAWAQPQGSLEFKRRETPAKDKGGRWGRPGVRLEDAGEDPRWTWEPRCKPGVAVTTQGAPVPQPPTPPSGDPGPQEEGHKASCPEVTGRPAPLEGQGREAACSRVATPPPCRRPRPGVTGLQLRGWGWEAAPNKAPHGGPTPGKAEAPWAEAGRGEPGRLQGRGQGVEKGTLPSADVQTTPSGGAARTLQENRPASQPRPEAQRARARGERDPRILMHGAKSEQLGTPNPAQVRTTVKANRAQPQGSLEFKRRETPAKDKGGRWGRPGVRLEDAGEDPRWTWEPRCKPGVAVTTQGAPVPQPPTPPSGDPGPQEEGHKASCPEVTGRPAPLEGQGREAACSRVATPPPCRRPRPGVTGLQLRGWGWEAAPNKAPHGGPTPGKAEAPWAEAGRGEPGRLQGRGQGVEKGTLPSADVQTTPSGGAARTLQENRPASQPRPEAQRARARGERDPRILMHGAKSEQLGTPNPAQVRTTVKANDLLKEEARGRVELGGQRIRRASAPAPLGIAAPCSCPLPEAGTLGPLPSGRAPSDPPTALPQPHPLGTHWAPQDASLWVPPQRSSHAWPAPPGAPPPLMYQTQCDQLEGPQSQPPGSKARRGPLPPARCTPKSLRSLEHVSQAGAGKQAKPSLLSPPVSAG
nr:basic salivary proline-rich protein 2-like [Manis javanica]